jgi:hypothetical protein
MIEPLRPGQLLLQFVDELFHCDGKFINFSYISLLPLPKPLEAV